MFDIKERGVFVYLRFRYSLIPSWSVTYSNPASNSCVDSVMLWLTLTVHWSFCSRNSVCSRLMYIIVFSMLLCPSMCCMCMMSLVLWYSIVAFQCLNVWKCILFRRGLFSFLAVRLLNSQSVFVSACLLYWNTLLFIFGMLLSMAISLVLIGRFRLFDPFSALM